MQNSFLCLWLKLESSPYAWHIFYSEWPLEWCLLQIILWYLCDSSAFLCPPREIISPWFHLAGTSSAAHTVSIRGTMAWISGLPLFLIISFLKSVVHLPPCVLPTLSFLLRWGLYFNSQPQSFCLFGTPPWFACLMVYMRHNFLLQVFIVCCHILFITFVIIHSSIPIFCS